MIITLTLNPAVDQTVFVSRVELGEVNRYHEAQLDPAGKGINVSRMAQRLGWPTIAFGFLAGEIGLIAERALDEEGVPYHFVHVPGQTRLNVMVVNEATGTVTNFYGPGPAVRPEQVARLDALLRFWLQAGRLLVLAGRLPPGIPDDAYAGYIAQARRQGVTAILDADGAPLRLGLEARPTLVKPNREEAERLLGRRLPDLPAAVEAARELAGRGIEAVVLSLGAEGAVCVEGGRTWLAEPPQVERRSTVGSGDSLVAGLAVALASGRPLVEGLRAGTAAGAATAMTPGTALGGAEQVRALLPQVRIRALS